MFIGSSSDFIGSANTYVGSWYLGASETSTDYLGQGPGDLWVYYDADDNVITKLDFGSVLPTNTAGQVVKAQYRGFRPIRVSGFHLVSVPDSFYDGPRTNVYDKEELIRWGDQYESDAGASVQFVDFDSGLPVDAVFKTGQGDTPVTFIEYTGHEENIVHRDQLIEMVLRVKMPSSATKEVQKAAKFHFGFQIAFVEIPENIQPAVRDEVC